MRLVLLLAAVHCAGCSFPEYAVTDEGGLGSEDSTIPDVGQGDAAADGRKTQDSAALDARSETGGDATAFDTSSSDTATGAKDTKVETTPSDAPPPDPLPADCVQTSLRRVRCNRAVTWGEARAFCLGRGGDLLKINGGAEGSIVTNELTMTALGSRFYIGLNDMALEGTYVWPDGIGLGLYDNWAVGQPANADAIDCVSIRSDGTWQAESCTALLTGFICES